MRPLKLFQTVCICSSEWLFEGTDDDDDDNGHDITENTRRKVLSIGQDVAFACSESRKLTPKNIGIGLTVHQATRSKQLVNLLHAAGHSASYEVIRKVNVSLAKDQLSRFSSNGNVVVPVNLNKGKFVQYAADNIDINEETLDGSGTFHATQMVAFQRGPPRVEDTVLPISNTRVITSVPKEFDHRASAPVCSKKNSPIIYTSSHKWKLRKFPK